MTYTLEIATRFYPLHTPFRIARGVKTQADVIQVTINGDGREGKGECVPYARYGETIESVSAQLQDMKAFIETSTDRHDLMNEFPAGAARNAIDSALWDLEGYAPRPKHVFSAQGVPIDTPEAMGKMARKFQSPIIKIKLGGPDDLDALKVIRAVVPDKKIIVDANEGWDLNTLDNVMGELVACDVKMIEQPLHADEDEALRDYTSPIPLYADEACHTVDSLEHLAGKYDGVNIKLDKAGGLTHALILKEKAKAMSFEIMLGCMVCSSRSLIPALYLINNMNWIDLDGAYWLANDPEPAIDYASWAQDSGFATIPI